MIIMIYVKRIDMEISRIIFNISRSSQGGPQLCCGKVPKKSWQDSI